MAEEIRAERIHANGLDFHVNACGEGPRLALCLHGFPELGYSWRHQLPRLAALGYRAWAPDLRGYGRTDRPSGLDAYAIERLIEDVAGLIDAADAEETLLIAHDWGAMIAWHFAAWRVRPLDRLVVMNGPPPGLGGSRRPLRQRLRSWYVFFLQIPWLPERVFAARDQRVIEQAFRGGITSRPERFSDEDIRVYKEAAAQPGATTAMINYYRGILRGGGYGRLRARGFPRIETPTLLIWGQEDPVLAPVTLRDAPRHLPDMTLRFIPGVGHWVQQEAPEEVGEILEAWLEGRPVPGAPEPVPAVPRA